MSDKNAILTLEQAADMLQVSTRTVQRMVKRGEMPGRQVGSQWRFDREQLRQWIRKEWHPEGEIDTQAALIEREARRLGVDIPQTLIDLQQAARKRKAENEVDSVVE